jgi:hypothetical protein
VQCIARISLQPGDDFSFERRVPSLGTACDYRGQTFERLRNITYRFLRKRRVRFCFTVSGSPIYQFE